MKDIIKAYEKGLLCECNDDNEVEGLWRLSGDIAEKITDLEGGIDISNKLIRKRDEIQEEIYIALQGMRAVMGGKRCNCEEIIKTEDK